MSKTSRLKIFASHRIDDECSIIENDIITPIRCGAVFDPENKKNIMGDDTGDNISERRCSFCELTVQYWAWKNVDLDYYGFCHYRRYFSWSNENFYENILKVIWEPYMTDEKIKKYHIDDVEAIRAEVEKYDIITVTPMDYSQTDYHTVREYYKNNFDWYEPDDLEVLEKVVADIYPEYYPVLLEQLDSQYTYYYNSYIMKKEIFHEYCSWLFDILFEFEKRIDLKHYSSEKMRSPGIMGERLFGVYLAYAEKKAKYKVGRKQLVFFNNTNMQKVFSPYFEHNDVPIFISSSDYFAPYASVTVQSLMENASSSNNYDIIFLHTDMSIRNQEIFKKMVKHRSNFNIRFYDVSPIIFEIPLEGNQFITKETFFRLIIANTFEQYDKAIFLDADTVVLRDIADLFNIDIGNAYLGATIDVHSEALVNGYPGEHENFKEYVTKELNMDDPYKYYQMGVLVMNLAAIREDYSLDQILTYSLSKKFVFLDQDILNSLFHKRIFKIDQVWDVFPDWGLYKRLYTPNEYYEEYVNASKDPYILHYAGPGKPWDFPYNNFAEYFWKYAKNSLFWGIILENKIQTELQKSKNSMTCQACSSGCLLKKAANKLFPAGSRRRKTIKKMLLKK